MVETTGSDGNRPTRRPTATGLALAALTALLAALHGWAVWLGLGGRAGMTNGWPLWRNDHPLFFHYSLVTRSFLRQTWTTAGYDPSFMSGHAKSIIFPPSATLAELVVALFGGTRPELVYKVYVLVSVAAIPWLIAVAAALWRVGAGGAFVSVALFLLYVWTDFPINYAEYGMVPYLLAVPLGLVATGAFVRYCDEGGAGWWLMSAALMVLVVLVHQTSPMVVAPAAAGVYLTAFSRRSRPGPSYPPPQPSPTGGEGDLRALPPCGGGLGGGDVDTIDEGVRKSKPLSLEVWPEGEGSFTRSRHVGVWLIPVLVLALNAFWWLPGVWLASTKGPSGFAFAHPEGVLARLWQIATTEAPVERWLCVAGLFGLPALARRGTRPAVGLLTFTAAGFAWGYLAGGLRSLDFLQPGRHTYAFFSGLALLGGLGVSRGLAWLRGRSGLRLDVVGAAGLVGISGWYFGPILHAHVNARVGGPITFLTSKPSPWLLWVVGRLKPHVRPGERLLYEEGGFDQPGEPDVFQGGRFSGLLPERLGVEVIGGPYLHAALTTNFTQFGEGKLFGRSDWDRAWFVRYARLYRPSAVLCWSKRARRFCLENPDLIEVKEDGGPVLIGRVKGFGGATIEGKAEVEATPGRLRVTRAEGGVDGTVVLRYHSVPCLRTNPPVAWDSVFLEADPVPFIRLRPPPGTVAIELRFPPVPGRGPGR